jgi:hypothetical protein
MRPSEFLLDVDEEAHLSSIIEKFRPHQRGCAVGQFQSLLARLNAFCHADPSKVFQRSCACGIIWVEDRLLAIHLSQFANVIQRSKSFVNAIFQKIGYNRFKMSHSRATKLTAMFPQMEGENLQSWTFREFPCDGASPAIMQAISGGKSDAPRKCVFPSIQTLLAELGLPSPVMWGERRETDDKDEIVG